MRSRLAAFLAALLACPPGVIAAPSTGTVQGMVTIDGRPLSGLELTLVDVATGDVHRVKTTETGAFELRLSPGSYVIASGSRGGLSVGRGPATLRVESGKVASANVEFLALSAAMQETPVVAPSATIVHEPIDCLIENEFPYFKATIEPANSVVKARVYFKSALSDEWYYVEMQVIDGIFTGILPRPQLAASPITYYIQATTGDFGEQRIPDKVTEVVLKEDGCKDKGVVAPTGPPPPGGVALFTSAGAAATGIPGFAAGGLALGTIGLGVAGLAALLGTAAIVDKGSTTTTTTTTTSTSTTTTTTLPVFTKTITLTCSVAPTQTGNPTPYPGAVPDATEAAAGVTPADIAGGVDFKDIGVCSVSVPSQSANFPDQTQANNAVFGFTASSASNGEVSPYFSRFVCGWRFTSGPGSLAGLTAIRCVGSDECSVSLQDAGTYNIEVIMGWKLDVSVAPPDTPPTGTVCPTGTP